MFYVVVISLILSSANGYTIKVQGKIEMGDRIAKVLEELRDTLVRDGDEDTLENIIKGLTGGNAKIVHKHGSVPENKWRPMEPKSEGIPFLDKNIQAFSPFENMKGEISLLEEMVNTKTEEAHVFGKHSKKSKKHHPLNYITV